MEYQLREGRHPTRADLDQAVPDRPAVLYHTSLHACVLNSAALRAAGFADHQPDPPGGAFGRDSEGRLDGVVFEGPMFALLERNMKEDITRMGAAERARLMQRAGQRLAALGLTAACDADLRRDTFAAFAEADQAGRLHQRIYGLVVHDQVDWLLSEGLQGRHSGRLATEAVKIWADGGMSSRTAAIHGTYPVPPHGSGILFFTRDELTAMVREFDARGFQVAVHAQGDRAIETVLDAYDAVLASHPSAAGTGGAGRNPRRHRIEHAGAMYPPLTTRAAELGIVIVSQPGFLSTLGDGFAAAFPGQAGQLYAFGSWRRAGLTVAGSSDAPVISAAPLLGIRDAMTRRTAAGPGARPGRAADRPGGARPVHHGGGRRDAPGGRDRLAGAGQARRLHRPGRQPARGRPGADRRPPGPGHRGGRNRHLPGAGRPARALTAGPVFRLRRYATMKR